MSKIFFTLFSLLIFSLLTLLTLPKSAFATPIITTQITAPSPPDIFQDTPRRITIEVTSNENSFSANTDYTFSIWNIARGENYCPVGGYNKNGSQSPVVQFDVTSKKITISWEPVGCMRDIGTYNFQLWTGRGSGDRNSGSLIGQTFSFTIQQPGGQAPSLSPLQQTVLLGTKPTVLISNARAGNTYTFWWAGSQRELAEKKTPTSNDIKNGVFPVLLNLSGGNFHAGQASTICMEIGNYSVPSGVNCHYSTSFIFSNVTPPTNTQCSILPSLTPTDTDDVNLSINNAIADTSYNLYLKKDGNDFRTVPSQIVDASGNLIIPLGTKLPQGTYATRVVKSSTNQTFDPCTIGFSVGPAGVPAPSYKVCDPKTDPKCTSGGGDQCDTKDNRGPAFKTAIGCIHTNPTELIKDFLTFIIGISGGLAFLMMLLGAFQMLTSAGNPETLNAGKDRLTSAIIGLLFIIFAILLLQIIGAGILAIPEFGK